MTLLLKTCVSCGTDSYLFDNEVANCCQHVNLIEVFVPAYITKTTKTSWGFSWSDFKFETKGKNSAINKEAQREIDIRDLQRANRKLQTRNVKRLG